MRARRSARPVIVTVASASLFVALARRAALGKVSAAEEQVFRALNKLPAAAHGPVWVVMQAGSLSAVPVAAAVASRRSRLAALAILVSGTGVWAASKVVKRIVKRGRPAACLPDVVIAGSEQRGGGFPSGHAAVATAITAIGARLLPRPARRVVWTVPVLVGAARQYVGAHLPLDVAGGAALGLSAGSLAGIALDAVGTTR